MQILPVGSSLIPARSAALERPAGARAVERVTDLLSKTRTQDGAERILQGELLEGGSETETATRRRPEQFEARREDHPAFYRRQANQHYVQRQALAAYQMFSGAAAANPAGRGVDYFV